MYIYICICIYIYIYMLYVYIHAVRHTSQKKKKDFEGFQVYHYHPIGIGILTNNVRIPPNIMGSLQHLKHHPFFLTHSKCVRDPFAVTFLHCLLSITGKCRKSRVRKCQLRRLRLKQQLFSADVCLGKTRWYHFQTICIYIYIQKYMYSSWKVHGTVGLQRPFT